MMKIMKLQSRGALLKSISALEWDLRSVTNAEVRQVKQRQLDKLKKQLGGGANV